MTDTPRPSDAAASTKYALVDERLGQTSLAAYLRSARDAGRSFLKIAFDLTALTQVELTQELVRKWVREQEARENREPSVLRGHAHHSLGGEAPAA